MAYNEYLADRVRYAMRNTQNIEERKMFGGLCFMVNDKMCVGVVKDELMVRLNPEITETALQKNGARPMDFTGKSMKGFIFVSDEGTDTDIDLQYWIDEALAFNPLAKASPKKK